MKLWQFRKGDLFAYVAASDIEQGRPIAREYFDGQNEDTVNELPDTMWEFVGRDPLAIGASLIGTGKLFAKF